MSPEDIAKVKDYLDWLLDSGIITYSEYQNKIVIVEVSAKRGEDDNKQTD